MEIEGLSDLLRRIGQMAIDTSDAEKPLRAAGAHMLGSIERNFQAQGRPRKWSPLRPRTLARRRGRSPKVLVDSARLKNSMSMRVLTGATEVGTNVGYGPRHHFGYEPGARKGRGQARTPARPFLLVQPEDADAIVEIFRRHVAR